MLEAKLIVNKQDRQRLLDAIGAARRSWITYAPALDWLARQLKQARECEPADVPRDVVTMNSRVEIKDLRTGQPEQVTLVYPGEEGEGTRQVSVFSPIGLALLGAKVGDVVGWSEPERSRAAWLGKLCYQPESAGDFHL
jgi:regulator of nucleoside diphosphate kinase